MCLLLMCVCVHACSAVTRFLGDGHTQFISCICARTRVLIVWKCFFSVCVCGCVQVSLHVLHVWLHVPRLRYTDDHLFGGHHPTVLLPPVC